jgi:hypothetical protein
MKSPRIRGLRGPVPSPGAEDQTTKGLDGGGGGRSSGACVPSLRDSRGGASERSAGAESPDPDSRGADSCGAGASPCEPLLIWAWNSRSSGDASRAPE